MERITGNRLKAFILQSHIPDSIYNTVLRRVLTSGNHVNEDDLIDFFPDRILEAKLDLLHGLIIPPDANNSEDFIEKIRPQIEELRKQVGDRYDSAWSKFLNEQPWKFHDGPFDNEYIQALSSFRDVLLGENLK